MAFDRTLLSGSIGGGSAAPKIFSYKGSTNTKAEVIDDGFFDTVHQILAVDDQIFASTSDTAPVLLYVVSITAGVVVTGFTLGA